MPLRHAEAIAAAAFMALAAAYLYLALQLPVPRYAVASTPGFLPTLLGVLLLGLSAAMLARALLVRGEAELIHVSLPGLARVAGAVLALILYAVLLEPLGFLLASFLFLFAVTPLFGRIPWYLWVGVPAAVAVLAHLVFVELLKLRLPSGLLPL
jgi:putative tricarboxylic transport membrane protein